jgi:hypothetical protein
MGRSGQKLFLHVHRVQVQALEFVTQQVISKLDRQYEVPGRDR